MDELRQMHIKADYPAARRAASGATLHRRYVDILEGATADARRNSRGPTHDGDDGLLLGTYRANGDVGVVKRW
jgi:hypothetical protein